MRLTFTQLLSLTHGRPLAGKINTLCRGISTDTRTIKRGDWFVALRGERFDAHDFLPKAIEAGASGLVLSRMPEGFEIPVRCAGILVEDTLTALGAIAEGWRVSLPVKVIAVTGSSGKTTTKDLLGAMMSSLGKTLVTEGNLNNLIGVPQMLQRLRGHHRWAVLEIGMSYPQEIDRLAAMIHPCLGVITNVGSAHAGNFAAGERGVFEAKAELIPRLPAGAPLILNADNQSATAALTKRARAHRLEVVTFSTDAKSRADVRVTRVDPLAGSIGQCVTLESDGRSITIPLPIYGRYNVANLAAATAAALAAGVPMARLPGTTQGFRTTGMRSATRELGGATLLVDCYNANPHSVAEAVGSLAAMPAAGRRIAVLGDMRELGKASEKHHREIGRLVARGEIDHLVTFGEASRLIGEAARGVTSKHFTDPEEAAAHLEKHLKPGDVALIKGSRALAMERIIAALERRMKG